MKNKFYFIGIFILIFLFVNLKETQSEAKERITDFSVKIIVNKDGTLDIIEKIIYDFSSNEKHGIYRYIPYIYSSNGKTYEMEFSDFKVVDETNNPYPFSLSKNKNNYYLKIGDPNKLISGEHTYIIFYKVKGGLRYFNDHDEIYWNAIGTDWRVPIEKGEVELILPQGAEEKIKALCFTGELKSKNQNCDIEINLNRIIFKTLEKLGEGKGLTILVSFEKGLVDYLPPKERVNFYTETIFVFFIIILIIFWNVVYPLKIFFKWLKQGRDPKPKFNIIPVNFEPPKLEKRYLRPAEVGVLVNESLDIVDIVATFIDLAVRGYLKIEERKEKFGLKRYYIIKTNKEVDDLLPFEKKLLKETFKNIDVVEINKDLELFGIIDSIENDIISFLTEKKIFETNPKKFRKYYKKILVISLLTLNFPLALSVFYFGFNLSRRTEKGVELVIEAKGLKKFLESQKEKLEFQTRNLEFFEKLLPYAIIFGVENVWIDRFKEVLEEKNLSWYIFSESSGSYTSSFRSSLYSFSNEIFLNLNPHYAGNGSSPSGGSVGGGGGGGGGGSW